MILLALIGVIGLAFLYNARSAGRLADTLSRTEALTAQEAFQAAASTQQNPVVTVRGRTALLSRRPEAAPLSEHQCPWWALRVRPLRRWIRGGRVPMFPRECRSDAAFAVTDGAHRVRVEPAGLVAYGHPASERVREPMPGAFSSAPLPPATDRVLRRCPELRDLVDSRRQRAVELTEWTLREGEEVAITGELGAAPDTSEIVLRRHRPTRRGRATVFGMTPGKDHTDVTDLRWRERRARWVGGGFTLFGFGLLLFALPSFFTDLAAAIAGVTGLAP
ncbi:hypothetical protein F4561_005377 [Lipingzhangella halophila]|uniref:Uncharacterized protein n=1 Tax=Lipingzhangella halophila TaxID=1783352 RepID=A0A7W7W4U8_9ACTN|nr:hypothetical protein [Lipingzhangella halophila]MBB4934557.1 hypothetical protein [Lipingzhangella halophila]